MNNVRQIYREPTYTYTYCLERTTVVWYDYTLHTHTPRTDCELRQDSSHCFVGKLNCVPVTKIVMVKQSKSLESTAGYSCCAPRKVDHSFSVVPTTAIWMAGCAFILVLCDLALQSPSLAQQTTAGQHLRCGSIPRRLSLPVHQQSFVIQSKRRRSSRNATSSPVGCGE